MTEKDFVDWAHQKFHCGSLTERIKSQDVLESTSAFGLARDIAGADAIRKEVAKQVIERLYNLSGQQMLPFRVDYTLISTDFPGSDEEYFHGLSLAKSKSDLEESLKELGTRLNKEGWAIRDLRIKGLGEDEIVDGEGF